jgi:hypothetical protein
MPASRADLLIDQGADYSATVFVENIDGTPADLTGWTAKSQLRRGPADAAPEIEQEISCTVQPPQTVILSIPHADTTLLYGRYAWDLDLTSPAGQIVTVLQGAAIIDAEVTR